VQGDDLVADDVVAGLEVLGDRSAGGELVLDEVVGSPGARAARGNQTLLRDLGPAKSARGKRRAVTYLYQSSLMSHNHSEDAYRCKGQCIQ
jgi:hypothetical protein